MAAVAVVVVVGLVALNRDTPEPGGGDPAATPPSQPSSETAPGGSAVPPSTTAGVPAGPATVPAPGVQGQGTVIISDDEALSDAITYSLTGVSPPAEGKEYVGWLVSDDDSLKLSGGAMTVESDGSIQHTMDHDSRGYTGINLVHTFGKVVITVEDINSRFDSPFGPAVFSHKVPLEAMEHIRHLLTNWPPGSDKGILINLKEQLEVAIFHANLSQESDTLKNVKRHAEHVVNIIEGVDGPNYGDLDGTGDIENPGDGIGVLTHAVDRKHAEFSASQARDDPTINVHAALVDSYGKNVEDLATQARDRSLQVLTASDLASARASIDTGTDTVKSLLEAALNGVEATGQGGEVQAYEEAQLMASFLLKPLGAASSPGSLGRITYGLNGRVYRIDATEGATPEDVSIALEGFSPGANDIRINTSPDGGWLVVESERFDPECDGWACLAIVSGDLSTGEAVRADLVGSQVVHPSQGLAAVASGGDLIIYQQEGTVGSHVTDLFAIERTGSSWGSLLVLTGGSPFEWHLNPAISNDGANVLFQCGDDSWEGHSVCEVSTDGSGFRVVLTPADSPPGGPETGTLHNPDYAPDGSIIFAADWDGDQVWRLPVEAAEPIAVRADLWSPCVLPDGRIAAVFQDWSKGGQQPDLHIRVLVPNGSSFITITTVEETESLSAGLGCSS